MPRIVDISGQRFGKLVAQSLIDEKRKWHARWLCKCDCGQTKISDSGSLRSGQTRSCGCLVSDSLREDLSGRVFSMLTALEFVRREQYATIWLCRCECGRDLEVKARLLKIGSTKHCGCQRKPVSNEHRAPVHYLQRIMSAMRQRCHNPDNKGFHRYGGRGIEVCQEWRRRGGWKLLLSEIGERPTVKHTVDRIDNLKGYEPGNVRWSTRKEQACNRRNNRNLTCDGETMCISHWATRLGCATRTIRNRINKGQSFSDIVYEFTTRR